MLPIALLKAELRYKVLKGSSQTIEAMKTVGNMVSEANFSSGGFPLASEHLRWVSEATMKGEFVLSFSAAILATILLTFVFLSDLAVSFFVFICVSFSLIEYIGFGYFFGVDLNGYTNSMIIAEIGLLVDYSIHISHSFLRQKGSKKVASALSEMGPPVLH